MQRIALIGAGNVATHLGQGLSALGIELVGVWNRTAVAGSQLAQSLSIPAFSFSDPIPQVDLVLVAISDDALKQGALGALIFSGQPLVAHTSGSVDMSIYDALPVRGGVFYPLQTFSRDRAVDLQTVPFCIEATTPNDEEVLLALARQLSDSVQVIDSAQRAQLHVAAVFANNFSNHLYSIAEAYLESQGLNLDLLRPLITETARKAVSESPEKVQTGPARRGDKAVINAHLDALKDHPEWQKIYTLLSESILNRFHDR